MKTFENALREAFFAGADYGNQEESRETTENTEVAYQQWRRRYSGLIDLSPDEFGSETSVVDESGSDSEESETVSGPTSEECEVTVTPQALMDMCGGPYEQFRKHNRELSRPADVPVCVDCGAKWDYIAERWYTAEEFEKVQNSRSKGRAVFGSAEVANQMNREGL